MNRIEFDLEFEKLQANPWEYAPRQDQYDKIADLYYDKLRNYNARNWRIIVSRLIDTDKRFPTFNRIYACSKEIIGDKERKDYRYCSVCGGTAYVSMLLSFDHYEENGERRVGVKEKHHWAVSRQKQLMEDTGERFYSFAFHCRCEKGEDMYLLRGRQGYQLSYEEFDELKEEVVAT